MSRQARHTLFIVGLIAAGRPMRVFIAMLLVVAPSCVPRGTPPTLREGATAGRSGGYLYVWAGDADRRESDFLAVLDARPTATTFGRLIATVPVNAIGSFPHHTEHETPSRPDWPMFANGFGAGRVFLFDLTDAATPRLVGEVDSVGPHHHPHSFARLPSGHVVATLQSGHGATGVPAPGGLAEFDARGRFVRGATAADASLDSAAGAVLPYSLAALPRLDRIVVTSSDMDARVPSRVVQLWRLSDLTRLHSIALPDGALGREGKDPAEPRLLGDGRTVLVSTFSCGLYHLRNVEKGQFGATLVHTFEGDGCALPVVIGQFWIQTVPSAEALVTLDVSDAARPREVARLHLGADARPHWIARDAVGTRIVVTGSGSLKQRVVLVHVDPQSGALSLNTQFHDGAPSQLGVGFGGPAWPHGATGPAVPHAVVFSRPNR